MKRLLALLLVVAMLMTLLVGCGGGETDPTSEATVESTTEPTTEEPTTEESTTEEPTTEEPTTEEPTTEETTTEEPTTEEPTTEETTNEETTNEETTGEDGGLLGNHIENGYENTVLGFGITLEDGWYFFNTNETASLGGKTEETFTEENVKASLVGNQVAYLLYAMKDGGVQNMNIVIQNGSELGFELTADNYIQNMFEPLAQTLAAVGCNNLEKEIANVSFAGREVPAMIFSADMNGAPLHEVVLPIIYENYVALLTICTTNTDGCADILAAFYPVSSAQ